MKETHEYLIPDYYQNFACKIGACRNACCEGWPISFSLDDYYHLTGSECSAELRRRLDTGVRIKLNPTPEAYAEIAPHFDGSCPMRLEDGRCAIHAELGEESLSLVCRLYPRGVRLEHGYECSCANSCEAVLELLFEEDMPISFSFKEMTVNMPPLEKRKAYFETLGMEHIIRRYLTNVIQDRSVSLPQRIAYLGAALDSMDIAIKNNDKAMLDGILAGELQKKSVAPTEKNVSVEHIRFGLETVERIIEILDARSDSIRACGEAALAYFNGGDPIERYLTAKARFEELFPKWEIFYEHMLVNHMFFSEFPFQDRPESMHEECVALCAVYAIMRFLGLGCTAEGRGKDGLIDGMAATFRLVDHTEFDRYASHLLKRLGCTENGKLLDLISL